MVSSMTGIRAMTKIGNPQERDHNYTHIVVHIGTDFRIIECRHGIQWIVQKRQIPKKSKVSRETTWRDVGYCRSRHGIDVLLKRHCGELSPHERQVVDSMPKFMEPKPRKENAA